MRPSFEVTAAPRWGVLSQLFHWIGAALVLALIIHGWWMVEIAPRADRFTHYSWHGSIGYLALALTVIRLLWRWMSAVPPLPANAPTWERLAARASHWGLYLFILGASVSGWALAGTSRRPLESTLLGWSVPSLTSNRALHGPLEDLHKVLAWALAAIVVVHIAAAFYHLWIRKDDVMRRMLPARRRTI